MNFNELNNIVPLRKCKDIFGSDLFITDTREITRLKAWNKLIKSGFHTSPNPAYLTKENIIIHKNSLLDHLIINFK
jgi:hypothetical protein